MKQNVYLKSYAMRFRPLLLLVALLVNAEWAKAQVEFVAWTDGMTYDVPGNFKPYGATFTAPSDGVLTLDYTAGNRLPAYLGDIALDESNNPTGEYLDPDVSTSDFPPFSDSFQLKAGQKLTLYSNFVMNPITVKVRWGEAMPPLELISSDPVEDGVLSPSVGDIQLQFSAAFKFDKATVEVGSITEAVEANSYETFLSVNLKDKLMAWVRTGAVKKGDVLTLRLEGLRSANNEEMVYGDDGIFTVRFVMNGKPLELVSSANTPEGNPAMDKFLSYYIDDTKINLTFDGPLAEDADISARLLYGDMDTENGFYTAELPVSVFAAANTVIVDLTGVPRRMSVLVPEAPVTDMALKISGVKGADGQYAYSNEIGSLGSYNFSYTYEELNYNIITDYTPATGSSIDGVKEVELWISGDEGLRYEGVRFDYTSGGVAQTALVKNDNIRKVADPDDPTAVILTIPVPSFSTDAHTDVTVSLANLKFVDGIERTNTYSATYTTAGKTVEELAVVSSSIAAGASIDKLAADELITLSTNRNAEIGCVTYEIYDLNPVSPDYACVKTLAYMTKEADGTFKAQNPIDIVLYEGHTYELRYVCYATEMDAMMGVNPVGSLNVAFNGATNEFEYSKVELVAVTPDPEAGKIPHDEDLIVKMTFSGAVEITAESASVNEGMGVTSPLKAITPNADKTEWELTVPASAMSGKETLTLAVSVVDAEGLVVKGNSGREATSFFNYEYRIKGNEVYVSTTPKEGEWVSSLTEIIFSHEEGIDGSWSNYEPIEVVDKDDKVVATITNNSLELIVPEDKSDDWSYIPVEMKGTLDHPLTASGETAGAYRIRIPEGKFVIGQEFDAKSSAEAEITFNLGATEDLVPNIVSPSPESSVQSLSTITLDYGLAVAVMGNAAEKPVVYDVKNRQTFDVACNTENGVTFTLAAPLTESGVYRLIVPARYIGDEPAVSSEGAMGRCNPALEYTFYVENRTDIIVSPEEGTVKSLKEFTLTCAASIGIDENCTEKIILYDAKDNAVATIGKDDITLVEDPDDFFAPITSVTFTLPEEVTAAGTYALCIPANMFIVGEFGESSNTYLTFHYTIAGASNVADLKPVSVVPEDKAQVASIEEITLTFDREMAVGYWLEGVAPTLVKDGSENISVGFTAWENSVTVMTAMGEPVSEPGTYVLTIPEGYLGDAEWGAAYGQGGHVNPALTYTFTVTGGSGIAGVAADATKVDVYTLGGVPVLKNAGRDALKTLKKGVYVINGKKVVLK